MGIIITMIVFAILVVALTAFLAMKANNKNKSVIQSLSDKLNIGEEVARISGPDVQYLGGHPMLPNTGTSTISFRERGFVICAPSKATANIYSTVKSVDVMDHEQISKDVTLTRFLAIGLFALAAKKKTVTHERYVKFIVELNGIENVVLIKANQAGAIASRLNAGRIAVAE